MEKDFVTFDQAKLLKEKGFLEPCLNWYHRETKKFNTNDLIFSINVITDNYAAPQQHEVVKWLLKNHDIWISAGATINLWFYSISTPSTGKLIVSTSDNHYGSSQGAYSAAIDYVLSKVI